LGLIATGLDALVTEDALGIVTDIKAVVDLHRLSHTLGHPRFRVMMMPRDAVIAVAIGMLRAGNSIAFGAGAIFPAPFLKFGSRGKVHGTCQKLEHHFPGCPNAIRVGPHHHSLLRLA
jgi:hypothetical protein